MVATHPVAVRMKRSICDPLLKPTEILSVPVSMFTPDSRSGLILKVAPTHAVEESVSFK
jgi:hypothetical protein